MNGSGKKYYITFQKEITQNNLKVCNLVKEIVQIYSFGEFLSQKLINASEQVWCRLKLCNTPILGYNCRL